MKLSSFLLKCIRTKCLLCFLCVVIMLAGCSSTSSSRKESSNEDTDCIMIGSSFEIKNEDSRLVLLDNMDALAADGLYYTTWTIGDSQSYQNSEGDMVDLYDAQLYLLLCESKNDAEAQRNMDSWLSAGKTNYEVLSEEEISCNGQAYTLITYNCKSESNPYARGVSAFGTCEHNSLCVELTCRADFKEDLKIILTDFLKHCSFTKEQ